MKWSEITPWLVGGTAIGLLIPTIYFVVSVWPVNPGEWLQFAGVFLGVAATMGGTIWLQNRTDRIRQQSRFLNLTMVLYAISVMLEKLVANPGTAVPHSLAVEKSFQHAIWARNQLDHCTYQTHATISLLFEGWEVEKARFLKLARSADKGDGTALIELIKSATTFKDWVEEARTRIERFEKASR